MADRRLTDDRYHVCNIPGEDICFVFCFPFVCCSKTDGPDLFCFVNVGNCGVGYMCVCVCAWAVGYYDTTR